MTEEYLRPGDVEKILKISSRTIYTWEKQGKLHCVRTKGGQRRFLKSEIFNLQPGKTQRRKICYCRVSTRSQKEDLERQISFFQQQYPDHEIIKDFGSGLNSKRKGFNTILDEAIRGNIEEVVVTHRDRFCRFNFEVFERIIKEFSDGQIVVLDKEDLSPEEEITRDLLEIITVFSSRIYGLRSNSIKRQIKNAKN
jgi:putative resolvase